MKHKNRHVGVFQDGLGAAAENRFLEWTSAVCAHHEQVSGAVLGNRRKQACYLAVAGLDCLWRLVFLSFGAMSRVRGMMCPVESAHSYRLIQSSHETHLSRNCLACH
jgi:hypothetical protein